MSVQIVATVLFSLGVIISGISIWNLSGMSIQEIPFLRPQLPELSEADSEEDHLSVSLRILEAKSKRGRRMRARVRR